MLSLNSHIHNCDRDVCVILDIGTTEVDYAERLMNDLRELRARAEISDALLILNHPPTVSLGLRDKNSEGPKDLLVGAAQLAAEDIRLVRSVRGGGITYHWPGQVICYPVMALDKHERDIPEYMRKLEQVGAETLESFGIKPERRRDTAAYIGLWVGGLKIMSMGVRISNWVTSFGFALNLEGDFGPSRYIRPCGIEGAKLTTIEKVLGYAPERTEVIGQITDAFSGVFDRTMTADGVTPLRSMALRYEQSNCITQNEYNPRRLGAGRGPEQT
jgi:lipoate-protein ligase B